MTSSPDQPSTQPHSSGLATIGDLKAEFGVSEATVHNWIKAGVPSLLIGRTRRFDLPEVKAWARSNARGGAA